MLENNTARLLFFILGVIALGIFIEVADFENMKENLFNFFAERHHKY